MKEIRNKPHLRKHHVIYRIENTLNGKYYIGKHSTDNVCDSYMGSGRAIKNAIKKHGKEAFTKEILFYCDSFDAAAEKEREVVSESVVKDQRSYNEKTGGHGGNLSDEALGKIRAKTIGRKRTEEQKQRMREAHLGKPIRIEVVEKRAKTLRDRFASGDLVKKPASQDQKDKHSAAMRKKYSEGYTVWNAGKKLPPLSDERKKAMSAASIAKGTKINFSWAGKKRPPRTEEHTRNIKEAWHSKKRLKTLASPEYKKKCRDGAIRRGALPPSHKGKKTTKETIAKRAETRLFSKKLEVFYAA